VLQLTRLRYGVWIASGRYCVRYRPDSMELHKNLNTNPQYFLKVLLLFTTTYTTYITFFDVKFEHSNFQGPFCENSLAHNVSLLDDLCNWFL